MAFTRIRSLYDGVLTGTLAATYTAPSGTTAIVTAAVCTNTTAGVVNLTLATIPRTAGTARTIISVRPVAAGQSDLVPELLGEVLEPGGVVQGLGSGLTLVLRGLEIVQPA